VEKNDELLVVLLGQTVKSGHGLIWRMSIEIILEENQQRPTIKRNYETAK